jgi:uncharacterized protein
VWAWMPCRKYAGMSSSVTSVPRSVACIWAHKPLQGALLESQVALDVRVYAQALEARVAHLRLRNGDREIDLIVERADQRVAAIEVKLTRTPSDADVRHLLWLQDRIGDDLLDAIVVTTGPEAYRRRDGIAVVPATLLGP